MKITRREKQHGNDDHLIPLINVVFLMLIFFMVIGRIAPSDLFQIDPPLSQSHRQLANNSITILIAANGALAVDRKAVSLETLIPTLEVALQTAADKSSEKPGIHIRADGLLTAGQLAPILEQLRSSGKSKVRLLTSSSE
ncbi:MAG: biopolymer transporter ExbD [Gammaproteobacteria bacterium]|nr:biopolymer transporter ExbD [Gammaproteobacteria bacterium]